MRIMYSVSAPGTALSFLRGQMGFLASSGHTVALAAPDTPDCDVRRLCDAENATLYQVDIERNPSLASDLVSFRQMWHAMSSFKPSAVITGTPKASFLLLLCSSFRETPVRIYLCHGLRYEGFSGPKRRAAIGLERLLAMLSTNVVAVSHSVRVGLIEIGVRPEKVSVLGFGAPNGIDTDRFRLPSDKERSDLRMRLGMTNPAGEILFVGRVTHDKGLCHLLRLATALSDSTITILGSREPSSVQDRADISKLEQLPNVRMLGRQNEVESYMKAADLLVLPTVREGMPTVVIEAAASGLRCVAMRATGTSDAVDACESGVLTPQGDSDQFIAAVVKTLSEHGAGTASRVRSARLASQRFANSVVWGNWAKYLETVGSV